MGMTNLDLNQKSEILKLRLLREAALEVKEVDLEETSGHKILENL